MNTLWSSGLKMTVGFDGCARYSAVSVMALRKGLVARRVRTRGGTAFIRPLQQPLRRAFFVRQGIDDLAERGGWIVPVRLERAGEQDAETIWKMQVEAFAELLKKYHDYGTNPGAEPLERVRAKLVQTHTFYYLIFADDVCVGAIRVVDSGDGRKKRISPLFILPEFRNHGYAQAAIQEAERLHGETGWSLDTILQEPGNCRLYEKRGYHRTGRTTTVNEKLTLVLYEK